MGNEKRIASGTVLAITGVIVVASVLTYGIGTSDQNTPTAHNCTPSHDVTTVTAVNDGTTTTEVATANYILGIQCGGGGPVSKAYAYADMHPVVLSTPNTNTSFVVPLHVVSSSSAIVGVSKFHFGTMFVYPGNPEWRSVTYSPFFIASNSSASAVAAVREPAAGSIQIPPSSSSSESVVVPGNVDYTVTVNLPPGYYEIVFTYTLTLTNGATMSGAGVNVPVTVL